MKRRKFIIPDSLELLLDTICNTFGAVIFISMLLSVLVKEKSAAHGTSGIIGEVSHVIATRNQEIVEARSRQQLLALQFLQQDDVIRRFVNNDSKVIATEIKQATENRVQLLGEKSDAVENLTNTEAQSLNMEAELKEQEQQLQGLERENTRLQQAMQTALTLSSRTARVPRVRETQKTGIVYMLHEGRLHRVTTPAGQIDEEDCTQREEEGTVRLVPRPQSGLKITGPDADIDVKFQGIDQGRQFVRLFVSQNSFAQFIPVKDVLISLSLEYEVILFEQNRAELFLSSQQSKSFVQ